MSPELQIVLIAVVTAVASALPGTYLVLRRTALVSDAISHAILPGIVVAFFLTHDLNSPLLLVSAAATGVLTVFLIESLLRSRLVPEDASIGLVFPALFSIGVILISRYAGDIHLDTDSVLLGELALAPFDQMIIGGAELGPRALWTMGVILLLNLMLIGLAWKELKLATVDPALAALLGFSPVAIHYSLMAMVSITGLAQRWRPRARSWATGWLLPLTSPSPDRWPPSVDSSLPPPYCWRRAGGWWRRQGGAVHNDSSSASACCWSTCSTIRRPSSRPKNAGFRVCTGTCSGARPVSGRWFVKRRQENSSAGSATS